MYDNVQNAAWQKVTTKKWKEESNAKDEVAKCHESRFSEEAEKLSHWKASGGFLHPLKALRLHLLKCLA